MSCPPDTSPWRLEWNEGLSVRIPEIDAEHQRFIHFVNALNEAIARRMDLEVIKNRLQAIVYDAAAHFAHEETLFKEWGYPDMEEHAQKHEQILLALHAIMGSFDHRVECEWIEAGLQVKQTLIDHILNEDMKYRDYRCRDSGGR